MARLGVCALILLDNDASRSGPPTSTNGKEDWKKTKSRPPTINPPESNLDDSDSSIDPEDFIAEYVSIQSELYQARPQLFDHASKAGSRKADGKKAEDDSDPRMRRLRRRLAKIENDVLFDHGEAQVRWNDQLNQLRQETAFVREKNRQTEKPLPPVTSTPQAVSKRASAELEAEAADDDEGLFGEMFAADASDGPSSILETANSHVLVRDFGEPIGLSPRRILEETCKAR